MSKVVKLNNNDTLDVSNSVLHENGITTVSI